MDNDKKRPASPVKDADAKRTKTYPVVESERKVNVLHGNTTDGPVKITLTLSKPKQDISLSKPKQDISKINDEKSPKSDPKTEKSAIQPADSVPDKKLVKQDEILASMQFEPGQRQIVQKLIHEAHSLKKKLSTIVLNDARLLKTPAGITESFLGHVIYTGAKSRTPHSNRASDLSLFLLPPFNQSHHYSTIEVRIPSEFLTYRGNIAVRKSALWGTDIYTDDSDVVAMIIHSGHYRPVDAPDPSPEEAAAATHRIGSIMAKSPISAPVEPLIAEAEPQNGSIILHPDHDLQVTLRILPKLVKYTGSKKFGLDSRGWGGSHDGESVIVEKVTRIERGIVAKRGRKSCSKQWGPLAKQISKDEHNEPTLVFSKSNEACIKYSYRLMTEWPTYLLNILHDSRSPSNTTTTGHSYPEPFQHLTKLDLTGKEKWPFWRIKLLKCKCVLFSDARYDNLIARYEIQQVEQGYKMIKDQETLHEHLQPEQISFGTHHMTVNNVDIPVDRISWILLK